MTIIPIIIVILTLLIIFLCYMIYKNKLKIMWPILILRYCLPIFTIGFFGQNFLFLGTIFECENGKSYVSRYIPCRTGKNYLVQAYVNSFVMILYFLLALITNTLYYRTLFIKSNSDVLKKINSIPDVSLLFTKVIVIIIFIIEKQEESKHWILLFILIIITGINSYSNFLYKNRLNITLMLLNIIMSLITFFGFLSLFIGNIFKLYGFNGTIYLYFIGILYIISFILFNKKKEIYFSLIDYKNIDNDDEYINYILGYYRLILNKDNSRNYSINIKTYFEAIEDTCTTNDCPLKMYLEELAKGLDYQYLLFKFLDELFKYGISKFRKNAMIKNYYAFFLISKMNNKKKAINILNNINEEYISFHGNYNIYRCKTLIKKWASNINNFYFEYKNNINEFKKLISKLSKLYYEFWALLYESRISQNEKFEKLYEIGSQIIKLNKTLDEVYNRLIRTKTNNIEIFKLYSDYIKNILKDEDKLQKYQNISSIFSESFENDEKDYFDFKIDIFKQNDITSYILLSGRSKDLGKILDCSICASSIFGYTKDEIIGRHINIFIPDIFHSQHNIIIYNNAQSSNLKLYDHLFNKKEYNPNLVEGYFFGEFKSKFIKSLKLKIYFFKSEENIVTFLVTIEKETPFMSDLIKNRIIDDRSIGTKCCILTDENYLIYSFTANSIEQLGLSYRYMKAKNSIIPFIKQLYEDYLNSIKDLCSKNKNHQNENKEIESSDESSRLSKIQLDINKISPEVKKKIKDDLINKKYINKCQITWRLNKTYKNTYIKKSLKRDENINDIPGKCSRISFMGSQYSIQANKKTDERKIETEFLMEIKKSIINKKLAGYYFYFSKIYPYETKNFISYTTKNDIDKNGEFTKIVKYKTIIKPHSTVIYNEKKECLSKSLIYKKKHSNNIETVEKNKMSDSFVSKRVKIKDDLKKKSNIVKIEIDPKDKKDSISSAFKNEKPLNGIVIDEDFIPKCQNSFSFDLNSLSYNFQKENINSKILHSCLHKQAIEKINNYQEYLKSLKNNEESDKNESNSEEDEDNSNGEEESETSDIDKEQSSNINSISNVNSFNKKLNNELYMKKAITLRNRVKSKIEKIEAIKETKTLKEIKEIKNNKKGDLESNLKKSIISNSINAQQIKKIQEKNNMSNYYKVNLSKIHYMIYDFNKDMFIEGKKNEIIAKVDDILNNSKKQNNIINIGKDERYPFILFKNSKEGIINSKKKNETDNIINEKNKLISEEKLFAKRINYAISNQKDEYELKIFKAYTIMTFLIILICLLIIFLINHSFYNNLKTILTILKNIISVKYCKSLSIYYIRELVLLNFNISNLDGGKYSNIPSHNRTKYENLIKNKLVEYFLDNQSSLKQILSSDYSLSKSLENDLSKEKFESKYRSRFEIGSIEGDALSILLQFNSILYNIASAFTPVYQNNPEVFNILHNGFNDFEKAIEYIWKKYVLELDLQKKKIIIYFIISSVIIIILFIISSYLMVMSFISAAKRRISYIQVFYGISPDSIKKLMSDCEKLINELKKDNNNNTESEEDMLDESEEDKTIFQKQIQNGNDLRNINLTKSQESKNNIIISLSSKLFFIFYILFMMGMYTYFPYVIYYLYNISNKTISFSSFIMQLHNFDMDVIEIFNVYREFLFDNKTKIVELTSYEYLLKRELEAYNQASYNVNSISNFIFANNLHLDPTILALFSKHICSYYITDFFNSEEQCKNKLGKIVNYEFSIIMTNFLQKIRNIKNIVRYKHQKELIFGELTMYEVSKWETWNNSFFGEEDSGKNKKKSFKLDLFNNDTLHSDINLLFINLLMPYLEENRIKVDKRATIDGDGKYFSKTFLLFLILLLLMYIVYLLPMINYISTFIYKTKNMLLLIPMTILSSQSNIKSLLNLT